MSSHVPSIDQLKEMALPTPVSYMPQTWGWWCLLGLLLVGLLVWAARRYWQWRRDAYRREALERLALLQRRSSDLNALRELPELLKRAALSMPVPHSPTVGASLLAKAIFHSTSRVPDMPPSRAGSLLQGGVSDSTSAGADTPPSRAGSLLQGPGALANDDWQAFLQFHSPTPLPEDFSRQLATLAYAPQATLLAIPDEQRQALFATCKQWLEQHHVAV
ncbi:MULTISPECIES: DUF4381 domain-containing protein [Pseudomonas]|uniref:DUF4381 domain-containing protein n=1 Tax=Pseudomonas TaxID=286 RepID=UPI000CFE95B3|nr:MULTISPECIES: DUF4381 domain-containing protein [Pseudomonas]PRA57049.1 hypothetical protein CQZ98_09395 [Pseudomonas sp. MYb115]QXN47789.1 DUF4381 domain-containing protein [Pseudomonas fluorescens]WSO22095.1 DUF4381 domain-containing protein [Pseudomonas fluorescens]